jgi:hypothetical protein
MVAYLDFTIAYCNLFDSFLVKANVDTHNVPEQLWHPILSKCKERYNFFIVQDSFVKQFRHMLVGAKPTRITQEAKQFLNEKGICIQDENHTYIQLYGCQ